MLAITFDDGQADNYLFARPVLQANGVNASFFVVTGAVESNDTLWHDRMAYAVQRAIDLKVSDLPAWLRTMNVPTEEKNLPKAAVAEAKKLTPEHREKHLQDLENLIGGPTRPTWDGMMSWDQLRTLQREGHEIGSHSASHPILPLVADAALSPEIEGSRATLEHHLNQPVHSFCYPNGDYDERVLKAVQEGGYQHAVSTRYGVNTTGIEAFALRRIDLQGRFGRNSHGKFSSGALMMRMSGRLPGAS
ncbi:MAG TPA: polysaccharide deacetylase family protein [Hydrogenophaga sp.]|nr:polysaccharide deacetylase family protein [Hydrogenophaga sp.]